MTKRRPKPYDPAAAERKRLAAFERIAEGQGFNAEIMAPQKDLSLPTERHVPAQRVDVFAMLHQRRTLTSDQLLAARRLEEDILAHRGMDQTRGSSERVDAAMSVSLVTDRMLDAGTRVKAVLAIIGGPNERIMTEIMDPLSNGRMLGNGWRDAVWRATGCDREESMGELVRCACQALVEAYRGIDNAPRVARKEEMAA